MPWGSVPKFPSLPLTDGVRAALAKAGYDMVTDPELSAVVDALVDGKFILAVKRYREVTRAGLAEAKVAVEYLQAELESRHP